MESNFREIVKSQHADYLGALDRTTVAIHKQLWDDFQKVRAEYGQMIHDELRIIRLRQPSSAQPPVTAPPAAAAHFASAPPLPAIDYTRFAFRFRGSEEHVRRTEEMYRPFFVNCRSVLDIGCGRGEFLELMREMGIPAKGIDLGGESVAICRDKGLDAEVADLFDYPGLRSAGEFDGIFASQLVEHLEPARLPEMIRLCAASLRRGGTLAMETPNPDCLAIFATYFYLDPTHTRPVPHKLLEFYMEEAGIGFIEVREISPAVESIPELAELPEPLRKRFFGGLDYAIVGRKL
jgi:O-antigen chain-terminating methyltransferase